MLLSSWDYSIILDWIWGAVFPPEMDTVVQLGLFHHSYMNLGSCFPTRDGCFVPLGLFHHSYLNLGSCFPSRNGYNCPTGTIPSFLPESGYMFPLQRHDATVQLGILSLPESGGDCFTSDWIRLSNWNNSVILIWIRKATFHLAINAVVQLDMILTWIWGAVSSPEVDKVVQLGLFHHSYLTLGSCSPSRVKMLLSNWDCSIFLTWILGAVSPPEIGCYCPTGTIPSSYLNLGSCFPPTELRCYFQLGLFHLLTWIWWAVFPPEVVCYCPTGTTPSFLPKSGELFPLQRWILLSNWNYSTILTWIWELFPLQRWILLSNWNYSTILTWIWGAVSPPEMDAAVLLGLFHSLVLLPMAVYNLKWYKFSSHKNHKGLSKKQLYKFVWIPLCLRYFISIVCWWSVQGLRLVLLLLELLAAVVAHQLHTGRLTWGGNKYDTSTSDSMLNRSPTLYSFACFPAAHLCCPVTWSPFCWSNVLWFSPLAQTSLCPEVEFLEEIQTEVLRVFLLAIHRHLY